VVVVVLVMMMVMMMMVMMMVMMMMVVVVALTVLDLFPGLLAPPGGAAAARGPRALGMLHHRRPTPGNPHGRSLGAVYSTRTTLTQCPFHDPLTWCRILSVTRLPQALSTSHSPGVLYSPRAVQPHSRS
jgi:hypothetical protein